MNKPNIILSASSAGCGKDTVAEYLVDVYGYKQIALADGVREIAKQFFPDHKQDRKLYQSVGQTMRQIDPLIWINYAWRKIEGENSPIVISDIRQRNEFDFFVQRDFIPLRVVADRQIAIARLEERDGFCDTSLLDNDAENGTRELKMPQIFNNSSVDLLYMQIDEFMKNICVSM